MLCLQRQCKPINDTANTKRWDSTKTDECAERPKSNTNWPLTRSKQDIAVFATAKKMKEKHVLIVTGYRQVYKGSRLKLGLPASSCVCQMH